MVHPRARDFSESLDSRDVVAHQLGKVGLYGHNLRLGHAVMSVRVHLVLVECGQTAAEAARCEVGTYHMKRHVNAAWRLPAASDGCSWSARTYSEPEMRSLSNLAMRELI